MNNKPHKKIHLAVFFALSLALFSCGFQAGSLVQEEEEESLGMWIHPSSALNFISFESSFVSDHQVAMNNWGETLIVWRQNDGVDDQIYLSEYRNGIWTHPTNLAEHFNSLNDLEVSDVKIAIDDSGDALVIWKHFDGSSNNLYKSEYRNGTWTHPADVNDFFNTTGTYLAGFNVAMDNNGNAIIVWEQDDGSRDRIYKSEYRSGTWTHPTDLTDGFSPTDTDTESDPEIAMNDNGEAIIVWLQDSLASEVAVYKSEYRSGTWTHPIIDDQINPDLEDVLEEDDLKVALSNNGEAIIVWVQDTDNEEALFMSEYRNNAWTHPTASEYISLDDQDAESISVAMADNGDSIIAWEQSAPFQDVLLISHYHDGAWTHPTSIADAINPPASGSLMYSDIDDPIATMDGQGNILVAWEQETDLNDPGEEESDQVFFSEYVNGVWDHPASITDSEHVISKDISHARDIKVARANNGEAMIVWEQTNQVDDHIFFSEFRK